MSWAGESSGSGIMRFAEDGSPGEVVGGQGEILTWANGSPLFSAPVAITGILGIPNGVAVGPNQQYTTLATAINDGHLTIHIVGDTTETTTPILSSSDRRIVFHGGSIVDMGSQTFSWNFDSDLHLDGHGEIRYAYSGAGTLFNSGGTANRRLIVDGVTVRNQSTVGSSHLHRGTLLMSNCTVILPDQTNSFYNGFTDATLSLINVEIEGGGTSCQLIFANSSSILASLSNIRFLGTYTSASDVFQIQSSDAILNNLLFDTLNTSISFDILNGCSLSNVTAEAAQNLDISVALDSNLSNAHNINDLGINGNNAIVSNVMANDLSIGNFVDGLKLSNSRVGDGTTTVIINNSNDNIFSNVVFDFTQTTLNSSMENMLFSNCVFNGVLNVNCDTTRFVNCLINGNLTFGSTASGNIVSMSNYTGALSDTGTDNQVFNLPTDSLEVSDVLAFDGTSWIPSGIAPGGGGGAASGITIQDEGVILGDFDHVNFVGAGVVATDGGSKVATVTIAGGGGGGDLGDLDDVEVGSAASGNYLVYDGANWNPSAVKEYPPSDGNPAGATPSAGDKYYDTGINHEMRYDGVRGKWLSVATFFEGAGRNGTTSAGGFYRRFNGMIETTILGGPVQQGTIVYIGQTRSDTDVATLGILVNGSLVATQASTAVIVQNSNVNVDFASGIMSLRNEAGSNTTSSLQASIQYKLRAL